MALQAGDVAPDFTLPDGNGNPVKLSDLQGKWIVLYFYPKDDTPGCTKEACSFRDAFSEYEEKGVVVLGINTNDAKSHTKFTTKYNLPFTLLTDADAQVATEYGSYGLKKFMGREYMGVSRHTFLIDPDGKIAKVYLKVKPEEHAGQILTDLAELSAAG